MPTLQDNNDSRLDPGQSDYERKVAQNRNLRNAEENGTFPDDKDKAFNDIANNYDQTADPTAENNAISRARQQEEQGDKGQWTNSVAGKPAPTKKAFSFRRKGPIGALIALLAGGAFGITALFSGPSLILVHIYEEFTGDPRFNTQLTSMDIRSNQMLASKFSSATTGFCTSNSDVSLLCKYSRPSNYLLNEMEKNGITAYDKSGNVITSKTSLINKKPTTFTFTDSTGKVSDPIPANELLSKLNSDPEFRAAFAKAYNPRFVSLMDNVFAGIKNRFGFSGSDSTKDTEASKINQQVEDEALGPEANSSGAATAASEELTNLEEKEVNDTLTKEGKNATRSGSGVVAIAGLACTAADIPSLVSKVVRSYQLAQVVRYAAVFLVAAGALKAGDATPTEIAALGTLLTATVGGLSAMDSFGMRNALVGDQGVGKDTNWSLFSPGASFDKTAFGQVGSYLNSPAKNSICNLVNNPLTGTATDFIADSNPMTAVVNFAIGVGTGITLTALAPQISQFIGGLINSIPASVKDNLLKTIAGDPFSTIKNGGVGAGDALASGAENMMSQTANAGGNMPLNTTQAVAYQQVTNEVAARYAQNDRITHSPLDATNPNTALGSFVNQFIPYYADLLSPSGVLSMISTIIPQSFSSLLQPLTSHATDPTYNYSQCQDPNIQNSNTAATPFCAIDYGIPPEYLSTSPTQVVSDLIQSGDLNADGSLNTNTTLQTVQSVFGSSTTTVSSLSDWQTLCTDGTTTPIAGTTNACEITNQQTADYALYTIDHRVQQTMDGEDTSINSQSAAPANTSSTSSTTASVKTSTTTQIADLLNSFNTQIKVPASHHPIATHIASFVNIPTAIAQLITNLPSKRASGVVL